ncbi:ethanolamine ammonia-lyase subunit EutC [Desulfovibrio sp. JY]|nr:ethanolamine ammonia-lyase subunit EutC [Desulfovibrio sp. JY]
MPLPEHDSKAIVTPAPWDRLRQFTAARVALGQAGVSLPTAAHLRFTLDHAKARDAVHHPLDTPGFFDDLTKEGFAALPPLASRVRDRREYLARPDLGRRLSEAGATTLRQANIAPVDLALVVADGLSSFAVQRQAVPLLAAFSPLATARGLRCSPIILVEGGRVAVGDEVGEILGARVVIVLIGERPGLSSPDSLGVYLTYAPKLGLTDERRNCISNIRPQGLPHDRAARTLDYLVARSLALGLSGVDLKDEQQITEEGRQELPLTL